ncbi:hypothetical protein V6N12_069718 [Hibiscus sabdariffa]|uniref:Uncharacterized protein n=1 Tax=Hibiscus sabdariffa TaxID=183260 RepID=A0ABR2FEQ4_9ROSI
MSNRNIFVYRCLNLFTRNIIDRSLILRSIVIILLLASGSPTNYLIYEESLCLMARLDVDFASILHRRVYRGINPKSPEDVTKDTSIGKRVGGWVIDNLNKVKENDEGYEWLYHRKVGKTKWL